jgi:hypothetical protein
LDVIKYIADFLNHDNALSLNQTCKLLHKHVPHKCHPKIGQIVQQQLYSQEHRDAIQCLVRFLNYDDVRSLNQTCKLFHKHVSYECLPHKCVPSSTQKISDCNIDRRKLQNGELALSERLILDGIPLGSEFWIRLIQYCYPNLKYLFIRYNCKCAFFNLYLEKLICVDVFMKINMLNINSSGPDIYLPSTMENFTAHISRIDPKTFKIIGDKYKKINLYIDTLEKLKSL